MVEDRLARGDQLLVLSRHADHARSLFPDRSITTVEGDPTIAGDWQQHVKGCDAVIHLAGAGIADHRWTKKYKKALFDSRIESTRRVVDAIAAAPSHERARVLINASAVGYYGDRGEEELDESAAPGEDFLAILTAAWEHEALRAEAIADAAPRVVLLRLGVVLDERAGALPKMAAPIRFFIGGPIASGQQWMSWIHWRDVVGMIDLILNHDDLLGPINLTAPLPVRNRDFVRALAKALHRPAFFPTPRLALRLALGEVANAITASQRAKPAKAIASGYSFEFSDLESAIQSLFSRQSRSHR